MEDLLQHIKGIQEKFNEILKENRDLKRLNEIYLAEIKKYDDQYTVPIDTYKNTEKPERSETKNFVAMLSEAGRILQVFPNQKLATEHIDQKISSMSMAIKNQRPLGGYRFMLWDNVDPKKKDRYLVDHELPQPIAHRLATPVECISVEDGTITTYKTREEAAKQFQIGPRTLNKLLESGETYRGHQWRLKK